MARRRIGADAEGWGTKSNKEIKLYRKGRKEKSEQSVETRAIRYVKARAKGTLIRKMNGLGYMSWPDRLFLFPMGISLWVEFKKKGKKPTPLQADLHKRMNKLDHRVHVIDNYEDWLKLMRRYGI